MSAARIGIRNPWALLAIALVGWASAWLVTWGHFGFFAWEPQGSLYDWQAKVLWENGTWDVPEKVTHVETFLVDGKAFMYFGPGPALLRFLTYAFGEAEPGSWSRPLVFLGTLATLFSLLGLIQWMARVREEEGNPLRLRPFWVGGFLLLMGFGSTLPFLNARAFVYHEAILFGSLAALGSYIALASYLREPRTAALVASGFLGTFSVLSRASVGGGTVIALLMTGILLLLSPHQSGRRQRACAWWAASSRADGKRDGLLAITMAALIVASFGFVNHQKFGSAFEGVPLRYHVSYQDEGRLEKVGGALLHLRNVPRNLYSYLDPRNIMLDESFPWIYPTLHSAIPISAAEMEPPSHLTRPSRRVRIYPEPAWVAASAFPNTYADFVERYASVTAVMPAILLLGLIGAISISRGAQGVGRYLRLPLLGALAGAFPFLMSVGITHRFLHDAFPAAAIACAAGLFALADSKRSAAKKSLVTLLILLTLWSGWANIALALSYQRIYSWGTPFFLKTKFNKDQFRIDRAIGDTFGYQTKDTWSFKTTP